MNINQYYDTKSALTQKEREALSRLMNVAYPTPSQWATIRILKSKITR